MTEVNRLWSDVNRRRWRCRGAALAQTPRTDDARHRRRPAVTFGVLTFLQYDAELHEPNGYNAFDVTRGYLNVEARALGPHPRPVHAGRAADDRRQPQSEPGAAPGIRVARREGQRQRVGHVRPARDAVAHLRGVRQPLPRDRAVLRRTPGPDSRADAISARASRSPATRTEVHVGVYNGEGYGRAEIDKYKSIDGRVTFRPFDEKSAAGNVQHLGVLSVRLVRQGSPAQRRHRRWAATRSPTSSPPRSICPPPTTRSSPRRRAPRPVVLRRRPAGSRRAGPESAVLDFFDPDASNDSDSSAATSSAARTGASWDAGAWASSSRLEQVLSDGQLAAARAPAARPDPRRVLGSARSPWHVKRATMFERARSTVARSGNMATRFPRPRLSISAEAASSVRIDGRLCRLPGPSGRRH